MVDLITTRTRALKFHSTSLQVVRRQGELWLRSHQIGVALGYKRSDILIKLYSQHAAEFTDSMTQLVKLPTAGGEQEVRVFSLRGAHLLAMFARTERAAEFRRWVLDVLDQLPASPGQPLRPAVPPAAPPAIASPAQPPRPPLANTRWLLSYDEQARPHMTPLPATGDLITWSDVFDHLQNRTVPHHLAMPVVLGAITYACNSVTLARTAAMPPPAADPA